MGRNAARCLTSLQHPDVKTWLLSPDTLENLSSLPQNFSPSCQEMWMEVGFGYGENMTQLLNTHPHVGIVGVEPFLTGASALVREVAKDPQIYEGRLKIVPEDVRPLLPLFSAHQFHRLYCLFSDPWPKKRHLKRRLLTADFFTQCARVLVPQGLLFLAHDHDAYLKDFLAILADHPDFRWKEGMVTGHEDLAWPEDWPLTRYAAKAMADGRRLGFSLWQAL